MKLELYQIKNTVCSYVGFDLAKKTRVRPYAEARFIYFYLADKYTSYTLAKISKEIQMNHASVIHGIKQVNNLRQFDKDFREKLTLIEENVLKLTKKRYTLRVFEKPKIIHPYRFRNAKQLRKIFKQRR